MIVLLAVACKEKPTSTPSPSDQSPALGAAIADIATSSITSSSIAISWTEPTNKGKTHDGIADATIISYKMYNIAGTTLSDITASGVKSLTSQASTSATITGLKGFTQYAFGVVATNSGGLTSTSTTVTASTTSAATAPGVATLMQSALASTSIGLVWVEPIDKGKAHDGITDATISYKIFYQEGNTLNYGTAIQLDHKNTSASHINGRKVVIIGLSQNTQYIIGVRTTNSERSATSISNTVVLTTKHYTKLGVDGSPLANQNSTWSYDSSGFDNGTEAAGTCWSCVRDEGTGLVWKVKTNKAIADDRDKDKKYQWGGLTAIGRGDANKKSTYYDDWNVLVLYANDQQLTAATDDGDAT